MGSAVVKPRRRGKLKGNESENTLEQTPKTEVESIGDGESSVNKVDSTTSTFRTLKARRVTSNRHIKTNSQSCFAFCRTSRLSRNKPSSNHYNSDESAFEITPSPSPKTKRHISGDSTQISTLEVIGQPCKLQERSGGDNLLSLPPVYSNHLSGNQLHSNLTTPELHSKVPFLPPIFPPKRKHSPNQINQFLETENQTLNATSANPSSGRTSALIKFDEKPLPKRTPTPLLTYDLQDDLSEEATEIDQDECPKERNYFPEFDDLEDMKIINPNVVEKEFTNVINSDENNRLISDCTTYISATIMPAEEIEGEKRLEVDKVVFVKIPSSKDNENEEENINVENKHSEIEETSRHEPQHDLIDLDSDHEGKHGICQQFDRRNSPDKKTQFSINCENPPERYTPKTDRADNCISSEHDTINRDTILHEDDQDDNLSLSSKLANGPTPCHIEGRLLIGSQFDLNTPFPPKEPPKITESRNSSRRSLRSRLSFKSPCESIDEKEFPTEGNTIDNEISANLASSKLNSFQNEETQSVHSKNNETSKNTCSSVSFAQDKEDILSSHETNEQELSSQIDNFANPRDTIYSNQENDLKVYTNNDSSEEKAEHMIENEINSSREKLEKLELKSKCFDFSNYEEDITPQKGSSNEIDHNLIIDNLSTVAPSANTIPESSQNPNINEIDNTENIQDGKVSSDVSITNDKVLISNERNEPEILCENPCLIHKDVESVDADNCFPKSNLNALEPSHKVNHNIDHLPNIEIPEKDDQMPNKNAEVPKAADKNLTSVDPSSNSQTHEIPDKKNDVSRIEAGTDLINEPKIHEVEESSKENCKIPSSSSNSDDKNQEINSDRSLNITLTATQPIFLEPPSPVNTKLNEDFRPHPARLAPLNIPGRPITDVKPIRLPGGGPHLNPFPPSLCSGDIAEKYSGLSEITSNKGSNKGGGDCKYRNGQSAESRHTVTEDQANSDEEEEELNFLKSTTSNDTQSKAGKSIDGNNDEFITGSSNAESRQQSVGSSISFNLDPAAKEDIKRQAFEEGLKPASRDGGVSFFIPASEGGLQAPVGPLDITERLTKSRKCPLKYEERMILANINRQVHISERTGFAIRDLKRVKSVCSNTPSCSDLTRKNKQKDDDELDKEFGL